MNIGKNFFFGGDMTKKGVEIALAIQRKNIHNPRKSADFRRELPTKINNVA